MKILLIHADFIEWEAKRKAISSAEPFGKKKERVDEVLVAFSSVEKADEKNPRGVAEKTVKEIVDVYEQVKAKNVAIYPFVHLSPTPSSPAAALEVLKAMGEELKKAKIPFKRSPFGWYKGFDIKCKGHPLAELSREITAEGRVKGRKEDVSEALKKEETLKSEWFIVEPNGKKHKMVMKDGKLSGFDFSKHKNLEKQALYELAKSRRVHEKPPHVALMKRLELVDYEEGSDPGNFRYYPKGRMIKSLLERWDVQKVQEYGAMEVETPIMYDLEHPCLKSYLNRFPARQYTIQTPNKRVFLRFAACFGQFLMAKDANISYRNIPLRMYELTRYSFRVEQRGELAGIRRLRSFTMPDTHAFCAGIEQAKEEFLVRFKLAEDIHKGTTISKKNDMEMSLRVVGDFWEKNDKFVTEVVKRWGKPALIESWDKRFFYFLFKMEWNFIDALGKAACLTTDQIDVENAERYGITYTDKDNTQKHPIILHMSPSGGIERVMYALLERACMEQKAGKNPVFPMWLSPTQVRMLPLSEKFVKHTMKLAKEIGESGIRVDVDDRNETVQKKIRDAELEWVPLSVVVGERELKSSQLPVRHRTTRVVEKMSKDNLVKLIKDQTRGFPWSPLPLPTELSRRPKFVGAI